MIPIALAHAVSEQPTSCGVTSCLTVAAAVDESAAQGISVSVGGSVERERPGPLAAVLVARKFPEGAAGALPKPVGDAEAEHVVEP